MSKWNVDSLAYTKLNPNAKSEETMQVEPKWGTCYQNAQEQIRIGKGRRSLVSAERTVSLIEELAQAKRHIAELHEFMVRVVRESKLSSAIRAVEAFYKGQAKQAGEYRSHLEAELLQAQTRIAEWEDIAKEWMNLPTFPKEPTYAVKQKAAKLLMENSNERRDNAG